MLAQSQIKHHGKQWLQKTIKIIKMENDELKFEKLQLPIYTNTMKLLEDASARNTDLVKALFLLERIKINGRLNVTLKNEMDLLLNKYK